MTPDQLAEKYFACKERLELLEQTFKDQSAPLKAAMEKIKLAALQMSNESGTESFKTPHGTVFRKGWSSIKVADREEFFNFLRQSEEWDLADIRANKTNVQTYVDDKGASPPGLALETGVEMQFRRPTKPKAK